MIARARTAVHAITPTAVAPPARAHATRNTNEQYARHHDRPRSEPPYASRYCRSYPQTLCICLQPSRCVPYSSVVVRHTRTRHESTSCDASGAPMSGSRAGGIRTCDRTTAPHHRKTQHAGAPLILNGATNKASSRTPVPRPDERAQRAQHHSQIAPPPAPMGTPVEKCEARTAPQKTGSRGQNLNANTRTATVRSTRKFAQAYSLRTWTHSHAGCAAKTL